MRDAQRHQALDETATHEYPVAPQFRRGGRLLVLRRRGPVQIELESHDIFVTTSSACSDNEPETSKVLKAMNIHDDIGRGVVRISLSLETDPQNYVKIEHALSEAYEKLTKIKY